LGSVLRLFLGSDSNEVVFSFGSFRGCYRKGRKSAVICIQKDPTKAAIYWTSHPDLQKDKMSTGGFFLRKLNSQSVNLRYNGY
jgi:hypothetical protein